MRDKKLDILFRKFDLHYAMIQQIMREIEHAEKKREIENELYDMLDKYNITKASNDRQRGDREGEF